MVSPTSSSPIPQEPSKPGKSQGTGRTSGSQHRVTPEGFKKPDTPKGKAQYEKATGAMEQTRKQWTKAEPDTTVSTKGKQFLQDPETLTDRAHVRHHFKRLPPDPIKRLPTPPKVPKGYTPRTDLPPPPVR